MILLEDYQRRNMKKSILFSLFLSLLILCACTGGEQGKKRARIVASKGLPSELLLVVDKAIWESDLADSIKALVYGPVPGLPQAESFFRVTQILSPYYRQIYTTMHSQLFIHLEKGLKKPVLGISYDVVARPQIQVTLKAGTLDQLRTFLSSRGEHIRNVIEDAQLDMRQSALLKKHSPRVSADLEAVLGMTIKAPEQIRATKKGKDFLWAGTNLNEKDQNIVIYTYAWDGGDALTPWNFAQKRDSVMRQNIPGSEPDQWMQTTREEGIPVMTSVIRKMGGHVVQEVHGLWEMRNGALGGPFVSLCRIDTLGNRVIAAEGFVYSPSTDKRELVRELEASLRTLSAF